MEKSIALFSFGHKFPQHYPQPPTSKTNQLVLDLRILIPDPWFLGYKKNGLNEATKNFVETEAADLFRDLKKILLKTSRSFIADRNSDFESLDIYFGCIGGYQRSVVAAEYFYRYFKSLYEKQTPITVKHLSLSEWEKPLKID